MATVERRRFIRSLTNMWMDLYESIGFVICQGDYPFYTVAPKIRGRIGITVCGGGTTVLAGLFVGVYHNEIAGIAALAGGRLPEKMAPTICTSIGYLMPSNSFFEYEFIKDVNVEQVAKKMIDDVQQYAIPYMKSHDTLEKILAEVPSAASICPEETMIVASYIKGDIDGVMKLIEKRRAEVQAGERTYGLDLWIPDFLKLISEYSLQELLERIPYPKPKKRRAH